AAGGAARQRRDRPRRDRRCRRDPAARLHHQQRVLNPLSFSLSIRCVRYRFTRGPMYAFTNVVEVRSNSGADGFTSYDSETISTSAYSSLMISPTRCSCAGLTKLNSSTTAIEDTPPFYRRRTCLRTSSSSRSFSTLPW